jgi:hypothetical protein
VNKHIWIHTFLCIMLCFYHWLVRIPCVCIGLLHVIIILDTWHVLWICMYSTCLIMQFPNEKVNFLVKTPKYCLHYCGFLQARNFGFLLGQTSQFSHLDLYCISLLIKMPLYMISAFDIPRGSSAPMDTVESIRHICDWFTLKLQFCNILSIVMSNNER